MAMNKLITRVVIVAFVILGAVLGGLAFLAKTFVDNMDQPFTTPSTVDVVNQATLAFMAERGIVIPFKDFALLGYHEAGRDPVQHILFEVSPATDPMPELDAKLADEKRCARINNVRDFFNEEMTRLLNNNGVNPQKVDGHGIQCETDGMGAFSIVRLDAGKKTLLAVRTSVIF